MFFVLLLALKTSSPLPIKLGELKSAGISTQYTHTVHNNLVNQLILSGSDENIFPG